MTCYSLSVFLGVLVVFAEERLEHGGRLTQDGDVDGAGRHEALQLRSRSAGGWLAHAAAAWPHA